MILKMGNRYSYRETAWFRPTVLRYHMPEYNITFVIELRLTGDMLLEADSVDEARAAAQQMLDHNVFDMDFTIYEGGVQSEDIFWDQELLDVRIRDIRKVTDNGDDTP